MKSCPECHQDNPPSYKFCHKCGASLIELATEVLIQKNVCVKCGSDNLPNIRFCSACGNPLVTQNGKKEIKKLQQYWYVRIYLNFMRS